MLRPGKTDAGPMKILICSYTFSPNVGGIETVTRLLAAEFLAAGHEVKICTRTTGESADDLGFDVMRNPSRRAFQLAVSWADAVLHNNISLPWALPLILKRKPWVCVHQNWPSAEDGSIDWRGRLKLRVAAMASAQVSVSRGVLAELRGNPIILGNPYDEALFHPAPGVVRDRDILFVGRLITGKAADTVIRAVALIRPNRPDVSLTVVGDGPTLEDLRALVHVLGLEDNVSFTGTKTGSELVAEMSRHTLSVVPSRARETFGIVALEAMGCGCVVIGSDHGGIPEAIGAGGPIFPADDVGQLARLALELLTTEPALAVQRARQATHLEMFFAHNVAALYLEVLYRAANGRSKRPA